MRISNVEVLTVGVPPPHFGGAYWTFVRLTTDAGVTGVGEVYGVPFHPRVVERMIEDVAARNLVGEDPFRLERLFRVVYSSGYTQRPDTSLVAIVSGLETACLDIIGKETGQPLYNLLGGKVREALRCYTYIYPAPGADARVYSDPAIGAARAATYRERGFSALKFDPFGPYSALDPRHPSEATLGLVERYVASIREAVGGGTDLLIGTHGQMTPAGAIRLARRLEPFSPLWFEEPVPPEMPEEMAVVARATSIPIATGERLATKYEFARVLDTRAAAVLQMAVGRVGGVREAKKIAAMAEPRYVDIAPHLYAGPVEAAANVHIGLSTPNFLVQESIEDMTGFAAQLVSPPLRYENGMLLAPEGPGLGLELVDEVVRAHPYAGSQLHLEMGEGEDAAWRGGDGGTP